MRKEGLKNVIVYDPQWSKETFQSFYIDRVRKRIKPNIVVLRPPKMEVYFETNSYGFKGPEIDFTKKLVAVWGDSVVWGLRKGWVEGLSGYFPEHQFLNGGLEGDPLENICERIAEANYTTGLDIKFNIIFPGWHSRKRPEVVYKLLSLIVKKVPNPVLCTVPTSLSKKTVELDLTGYFVSSPDKGHYGFWGNTPYSIENARLLFSEIQRQNEVIHAVARENKIPLVDLYSHFYTEDIERFREDFFDAGHFRKSAYPKIQKIFYEELKDVLV
ncbi:MAG TPA: hypothetical protein ENK09_00360 [Nitrospirae bacterium]|nr:hypothetical protein [Nitrospirota bacterium]